MQISSIDRIYKAIKNCGLDSKSFIIGNGANSKGSEIRYRPSEKKYENNNVEYAIQFFEDVMAIWEIKKRIELNASMDLVWTDYTWSDIDSLQIKEIRIGKKDDSCKVAIMPIISFEAYLNSVNDKENEYYYDTEQVEGKERIRVFSTYYERDEGLRELAIRFHGTRCQACDFIFKDKYGEIGDGFIEVHHIKPISEGLRETNPETDMVCLCSNCHSMVHRNPKKVLSIDELKQKMNP